MKDYFKLCAWLENGALLQQGPRSIRTGTEEISSTSMPCWYMPDFFLQTTNTSLSFKTESVLKPETVKLSAFPLPQVRWQEPSWDKIKIFFDEFKRTSLEKVVIYATYKARLKVTQEWLSTLLCRAFSYQRRFPALSLYGYWNAKEGVLGVTPELLCKASKGNLKTVALAGTVPLEKAHLLLTDLKLLKEQQLVVEGILKRWENEASFFKPKIFKMGNLAHLLSKIRLHSHKTVHESIGKLHPTPALGVFPYSDEGRKWLADYAIQFPRKRFGAPFGYLKSETEGTIYVCIRGIEWSQEELFLTVGCGIVKESVFEEEKKELQLKFETVKNIFQL